jgi:hypothetical protein
MQEFEKVLDLVVFFFKIFLIYNYFKFSTKEFSKKNHDNLLDELKLRVQNDACKSHKWDAKAMDSLVLI